MATKPPQEAPIGDGTLHVGDRVVYPNQGICRITGVETKMIAGSSWEVVTMSREEDGATVMVPRAKVMGIGLRKVADVAAIDEVFDQLAAPGEIAQLDWKVRHRENADRMHGGGLFGTVEVLKGLHALSRIRPLPQKERELYDNARHLLVGEIAAAMSIPLHVAEDNLDYALWPPVGMKRKGVTLEPATLGPPPAGPVRVARDEDDGADDLGFEDDDAKVPAAAGVKDGDAKDDDETDEVDEDADARKVAVKAPAALKAAIAAVTKGAMTLALKTADLVAPHHKTSAEKSPGAPKPPAAIGAAKAPAASAAKEKPAFPKAAPPAPASPAKAAPALKAAAPVKAASPAKPAAHAPKAAPMKAAPRAPAARAVAAKAPAAKPAPAKNPVKAPAAHAKKAALAAKKPSRPPRKHAAPAKKSARASAGKPKGKK